MVKSECRISVVFKKFVQVCVVLLKMIQLNIDTLAGHPFHG